MKANYIKLNVIHKLAQTLLDEITTKQVTISEIQKAILLIKEIEIRKSFISKIIGSISIIIRERKRCKLSKLMEALSIIRKLQKKKYKLKDIQIALFYIFNKKEK
jgi:hypothetical protein